MGGQPLEKLLAAAVLGLALYGILRMLSTPQRSPFRQWAGFLPWLLIPLGTYIHDPWIADPALEGTPLLTGNPALLIALGIILTVWGAYTCWLLLRDPAALARTENHPSWTHMYLMMMAAQVGFAVAYVF